MPVKDREGSDGGVPKTRFHTVRNNPPSIDDFLSNEREGKRLPRQIERVRFWRGFSCFDTLEAARRKAISFPSQGTFIAEIAVAGVAGIIYEQSLGPGHFTVWAEPAVCVAQVIAVYPVRDTAEDYSNANTL